ncbi:MAG: hypothetical protein AB8G11_16710 [Saprospiraceae bacterium]
MNGLELMSEPFDSLKECGSITIGLLNIEKEVSDNSLLVIHSLISENKTVEVTCKQYPFSIKASIEDFDDYIKIKWIEFIYPNQRPIEELNMAGLEQLLQSGINDYVELDMRDNSPIRISLDRDIRNALIRAYEIGFQQGAKEAADDILSNV